MDINRLYSLIEERGLNAVLLFSPENVLYTSNCNIKTQREIRDRLACTIFSPQKDPTLVLCNIETTLAEEESWIKDLVSYVEFKESPIAAVARALKEKELVRGKLGVEIGYLPAKYFMELQAALPEATMEDCAEIFVEMRAIKTPEEVAHQERISRITVDVIEKAFAETKVGDTDTDVYHRMMHGLIENGAEPVVAIVAVGKRGSIAHPKTIGENLNKHDVIRVDIAGKFDGYYSDVARTVVVGEPTRLQADYFRKFASIQKHVIDSIKPGNPLSGLYNTCAERLKAEGIHLDMPHIGHGMGLEIHEYPMIHPGNHDLIREGMVLNIEPLVIDPEGSGYHIEDLAVVTSDGVSVLTGSSFPQEIPVVG